MQRMATFKDSSARPGSGPVSFCFFLLTGLLVLAACGGSAPGEDSGEADALGELAEVELASLNGGPVRLDDFEGRIVVVDFWATWCSPCRIQAEILHDLHEEFGDRDVQFLAVSVGEPEDIVRDFAKQNPFPYPVLVDPEEILGRSLEIYALPTVMIVDPTGAISYLRSGVSNGHALRRALRESGASAT